MLFDAFRWFLTLLEVIAVIAIILLFGLIAAVVVLRGLGKLAGPPIELDPETDKMDSGNSGPNL